MDEAGVRQWLSETFDVSRETVEKLDAFVAMLVEENDRQNLIAQSTVPDIWDRHIRDSAQILTLARHHDCTGRWLDLGSGPGLPGLVIAILSDEPMTLVESRTRRAEFLNRATDRLALADRVRVVGARVERLPAAPYAIITARAFAPLPKLLDLAVRFARPDTMWLLPKGRTVDDDLATIRPMWQGQFDTVQSLTDPHSFIVCAREVRRRKAR